MTQKTNKELYAELAEKIKEIEDKAAEVAKFATQNKLTFNLFGSTFVPKTKKVRSEWSEELLDVERVGPGEDGGFYPEDRGTFWVSSNCY